MGTAGAIIGGTLLGLGAAGMSKQPSYGGAMQVHSTMTPSLPQTPEPPAASVNASDTMDRQNSLMEAERERERQQAALRKQRAQEIYTTGLGAAGTAETAKKTLLGG